ncbi:peptidoglycan DD-metalloendopeptidase family protein [Janthinobacterium sp. SUN120]|uniref:murein hydrolase activator EnvC family protein n=1 Tax=Janthinobacterium sp. SUN120 TaxID=3004099 RepID=UPI0025B277D8|nr:peptidoglycan DD-metalloendopeptidase family protein [Janthinobacterium sp. SUN120]MDN2717367.1 peptidoglycan DD-metalloendopeptidase family protein [Janthinobacterium sp. SUN120]
MLCLALLLSSGAAQGAKPTERSKQKAAAEAQRAGLQQKLTALKRDISRTESAKDDAADTLAESEEAISNANRALRDLAQEQSETGVKLNALGQEHQQLTATVEKQKTQLSKLLREQYVAGNEDRIKLLLSGDNPNRINRDLQLMAYVSQAQARLLEALRANLLAVEKNQAEVQNAKDELEEIAQEERDQKALLVQEKARRAALLTSLSQRLVAQRKEVGNVERDEQRMGNLVDKLAKLIEEQAAAAAAEKKRQQLLAEQRAAAKAAADAKIAAEKRERLLAARAKAAQAQAERERLAKEQQNKSGKIKPQTPPPPPVKLEPIDDDEPPQVAKVTPKPEPKPEPEPDRPSLGPAAPVGAFASMKGQLRAPVAGKIAARFGSKRGDGPSWKGVFIRTGEGSEIHAIAGGRVVFSDWLRGFGNLIIVDHGGQYMSIYGNNQSLLKRVGDAVKGGEAIASAGNSGGNEESGLYFELRHQGRAFDPATWVKF